MIGKVQQPFLKACVRTEQQLQFLNKILKQSHAWYITLECRMRQWACAEIVDRNHRFDNICPMAEFIPLIRLPAVMKND